jgi:hypothetical protein
MVIDLHNHSSEASQCSRIDAATLRMRYGSRPDIEGFCLTDHLSERNLPHLVPGDGREWSAVVRGLIRGFETASRVPGAVGKIFFGFEYGIGYDDFLVYGLDPEDLEDQAYLLGFDWESLSRLRRRFPHIAIIQAHPFRRRCRPADARLLDGVEVFNGMFFHDQENAEALEFARAKGLPATGGTDCHEDDVGRMMTKFQGPIATNRGLAEAIRGGWMEGFRIKDIKRDEFIPYSVVHPRAREVVRE